MSSRSVPVLLQIAPILYAVTFSPWYTTHCNVCLYFHQVIEPKEDEYVSMADKGIHKEGLEA